MASVRKVSLQTEQAVINSILEQDGCVVMKKPFRRMICKNQGRLDTCLEKIPNCQGNFYGFATKRMSGLIEKSVTGRKLAVIPQVLNVMDHFLLPSCSDYQLNLTQAIRIGPGEPQQLIHTDDLMFRYTHPGAEAMINCMWAIDDFTDTNGATVLVPGSHKWEKERIPKEEEITKE